MEGEEGIRISLDPRNGEGITEEELGLERAKFAVTPMISSQSGKMDSDSFALSYRDATLYQRLLDRHSLRCIGHGESRIKPGRYAYGQTQQYRGF